MDALSMMFSGILGDQQSWIEAAFLVSLFWVAMSRPTRIRSLIQFRIACLLFALTLIAPTLVSLSLFSDNPNPVVRNASGSRPPDLGRGLYLRVLTPAFLMLSFLMAIDSVIPRQKTANDEQGAAPASAT